MPYDVSIATPISDTLMLVSLEGHESISETFSFRLELSSSDAAIDLNQALTKAIAVTFKLPSGQSQILHGIVTSFGQGAKSENGSTTYFARIEPWLSLLRLNTDQRIFQNQTVPDILTKVFTGLGLADYKNSLTGTYTARDYCVQFGETTFDFISRLMESEGIFYYFTHTASAHTLVLADDDTAFPALPGIDTIRFNQTNRSSETIDVMIDGGLEQHVTPIKVAADDFNFITPATDLYSVSEGSGGGTFASVLSIYNYPGLFTAKADGETTTGLQLTGSEVDQKLLRGRSMCRAFQSGSKFTLAGHFSTVANTGYVLRSVTHHYVTSENRYSNSFVAFPASVTFRPPQVTPRAIVRGAQTAIVVGKSGEEIWTDQYGRIKVKFHWDQSTAQDETCSCWIRVAQSWAGQQWGAFFLPRIGQEVIVSFLDGNPDRPIVTGSVYNGQQTVPYALPDQQTRTTIKSNSSKGGSGFNEIRFEDKAGSEEVFLQAQKDMNVSVLGDQAITVAKKRDITVTGDETHTDKAKFTHTVTGDYALKVSGNLTIDVTGSISIKSGTSFDIQAGTALSNRAGTSMNNEAQVSITSKANASHTVESSGILELKGSLVKIN